MILKATPQKHEDFDNPIWILTISPEDTSKNKQSTPPKTKTTGWKTNHHS